MPIFFNNEDRAIKMIQMGTPLEGEVTSIFGNLLFRDSITGKICHKIYPPSETELHRTIRRLYERAKEVQFSSAVALPPKTPLDDWEVREDVDEKTLRVRLDDDNLSEAKLEWLGVTARPKTEVTATDILTLQPGEHLYTRTGVGMERPGIENLLRALDHLPDALQTFVAKEVSRDQGEAFLGALHEPEAFVTNTFEQFINGNGSLSEMRDFLLSIDENYHHYLTPFLYDDERPLPDWMKVLPSFVQTELKAIVRNGILGCLNEFLPEGVRNTVDPLLRFKETSARIKETLREYSKDVGSTIPPHIPQSLAELTGTHEEFFHTPVWYKWWRNDKNVLSVTIYIGSEKCPPFEVVVREEKLTDTFLSRLRAFENQGHFHLIDLLGPLRTITDTKLPDNFEFGSSISEADLALRVSRISKDIVVQLQCESLFDFVKTHPDVLVNKESANLRCKLNNVSFDEKEVYNNYLRELETRGSTSQHVPVEIPIELQSLRSMRNALIWAFGDEVKPCLDYLESIARDKGNKPIKLKRTYEQQSTLLQLLASAHMFVLYRALYYVLRCSYLLLIGIGPTSAVVKRLGMDLAIRHILLPMVPEFLWEWFYEVRRTVFYHMMKLVARSILSPEDYNHLVEKMTVLKKQALDEMVVATGQDQMSFTLPETPQNDLLPYCILTDHEKKQTLLPLRRFCSLQKIHASAARDSRKIERISFMGLPLAFERQEDKLVSTNLCGGCSIATNQNILPGLGASLTLNNPEGGYKIILPAQQWIVGIIQTYIKRYGSPGDLLLNTIYRTFLETDADTGLIVLDYDPETKTILSTTPDGCALFGFQEIMKGNTDSAEHLFSEFDRLIHLNIPSKSNDWLILLPLVLTLTNSDLLKKYGTQMIGSVEEFHTLNGTEVQSSKLHRLMTAAFLMRSLNTGIIGVSPYDEWYAYRALIRNLGELLPKQFPENIDIEAVALLFLPETFAQRYLQLSEKVEHKPSFQAKMFRFLRCYQRTNPVQLPLIDLDQIPKPLENFKLFLNEHIVKLTYIRDLDPDAVKSKMDLDIDKERDWAHPTPEEFIKYFRTYYELAKDGQLKDFVALYSGGWDHQTAALMRVLQDVQQHPYLFGGIAAHDFKKILKLSASMALISQAAETTANGYLHCISGLTTASTGFIGYGLNIGIRAVHAFLEPSPPRITKPNRQVKIDYKKLKNLEAEFDTIANQLEKLRAETTRESQWQYNFLIEKLRKMYANKIIALKKEGESVLAIAMEARSAHLGMKRNYNINDLPPNLLYSYLHIEARSGNFLTLEEVATLESYPPGNLRAVISMIEATLPTILVANQRSCLPINIWSEESFNQQSNAISKQAARIGQRQLRFQLAADLPLTNKRLEAIYRSVLRACEEREGINMTVADLRYLKAANQEVETKILDILRTYGTFFSTTQEDKEAIDSYL